MELQATKEDSFYNLSQKPCWFLGRLKPVEAIFEMASTFLITKIHLKPGHTLLGWSIRL
jgi:hypothetical protein